MPTDPAPLRQRDIFFFWLPLFASWLLMTLEGPFLSAVVNRMPDEVVMLAALGIVITLAIAIESPIVNLLATATALVKDRASYELLRRFTLHWIAILTAIAALLAFTPAFDLVILDVLGTPEEVAVWVRPGLQILTLWTAAIGWRRFLQGILIRFGQTRKVARGTMLRLVSMVGTAFGLATWTDWPGIHLASAALMAGVLTEALYATIVVRPVLKQQLAPDPEAEPSTLTYRELFWFHLPLAGTAALALLIQPLVTFTLARLPQPTLTLAAWPLIFHATLAMRSPGFSLPEAVIALTRDDGSTDAAIRRFSLTLTGVVLAGVALFAASPIVSWYLSGLQDATADVAAPARLGLLLLIPFPALTILTSWLNGLLIHGKRTRIVNEAMMVNVAVTVALLAAGLAIRWPGITTAAVALDAALAAQLLYLLWRR